MSAMSGKAVTLGHQRHGRPPAVMARRAPRCAVGAGVVLVPWARIDDGFDDHPKVLALLEHDDGAAALGLWLVCFTWANRNTRKKGKVPGHLPASLPRRYLGAPGRDAAKLLVDVGLWDPDLDEGGWHVHDFSQHLPTAETSTARAQAGRRGAAARWGKRGETPASDGKLLSADGKPDGPAMAGHMANDGNWMAPDGETPVAAPDGHPDGSMPSADSNLPSGDGKPDGQAMASDGSRARTQSHTQSHKKVKDVLPAATPRDDVTSLCEHLAERMVANGCKRPAITQKWLDAARLMIDADGRTEAQVHACIDWSQKDEFWHRNIHSMPTLRAQYDKLRLAALAEQKQKSRPNGTRGNPDDDYAEAMQRIRARKESANGAGGNGHDSAPGQVCLPSAAD
jgi:hypothetical protein